MGGQHQKHKRAKTEKIQNMEENAWRTKIKLLDDNNGYRAQFLETLSEFQPMLDRHLGQNKAAKHRIELSLAGKPQCIQHRTKLRNARGILGITK